jgi:CheY-like chemotaxis protein
MPSVRPRVLLIDPDMAHGQLLAGHLANLPAIVQVANNRTEATAMMAQERFSVVMVDPSPMRDLHNLVLSLRQKIPTYAYIALMLADESVLEGLDSLRTGANIVVRKPVGKLLGLQILEQAVMVGDILARLNDPSTDYPSTRGIIAKSAFCQLFTASLDRADRYGEEAHVLFIKLLNYNQIKVMVDEYHAGIAAATLAQQLSRLRRQSDILAQTGDHEYALLLQRPAYSNEPAEAALRFADALSNNPVLASSAGMPLDIEIKMIELPSGALSAHHEITTQA